MRDMKVCSDCRIGIANDDFSQLTDEDYERVRDAVHNLPAGAALTNLEYGFQIDPCECCGSKLHGDRYEVLIYVPTVNRDNLLKLADYLDSLPADYEHFHMEEFMLLGAEGTEETSVDFADLPLSEDTLTKCGSAACMIGHGPSAGIGIEFLRENQNIGWQVYGRKVFGTSHGTNEDVFTWLFGHQWAGIDNTHRGGAARIRYFLEHGLPTYQYPLDSTLPKYQDYLKKGTVSKFTIQIKTLLRWETTGEIDGEIATYDTYEQAQQEISECHEESGEDATDYRVVVHHTEDSRTSIL